jgi:CBS domain-containing protein
MRPLMIIGLLTLGIVLVVGSLLLRVFSDGKYEFKTIDLVFLIIPLVVAALATGKLKGVDLFGVKADLSELWTQAAQTQIAEQVGPAPAPVQDVVQGVEMASKGGLNELQRLLPRNIEALEFKLGAGGYYAPAIKTYLEALSGSAHLRAVVVNLPDGTLFGMYNAAVLIGYLRVAGDEAYRQFQQLLNSGDERAREELAKLPGFVSAEQAVTASTSKRAALARMEQLNTESLPVVNEHRHLVGTVERAKLMASLLLSVTDKLAGR